MFAGTGGWPRCGLDVSDIKDMGESEPIPNEDLLESAEHGL